MDRRAVRSNTRNRRFSSALHTSLDQSAFAVENEGANDGVLPDPSTRLVRRHVSKGAAHIPHNRVMPPPVLALLGQGREVAIVGFFDLRGVAKPSWTLNALFQGYPHPERWSEVHLQASQSDCCLHDVVLICLNDTVAVAIDGLHPANDDRISEEGQNFVDHHRAVPYGELERARVLLRYDEIPVLREQRGRRD